MLAATIRTADVPVATGVRDGRKVAPEPAAAVMTEGASAARAEIGVGAGTVRTSTAKVMKAGVQVAAAGAHPTRMGLREVTAHATHRKATVHALGYIGVAQAAGMIGASLAEAIVILVSESRLWIRFAQTLPLVPRVVVALKQGPCARAMLLEASRLHRSFPCLERHL